MNRTISILFFILAISLICISCPDDDSDNDNTKQYTVYSYLDSDEPLVLNKIADLSTYIDLTIDIDNIQIAKALYDWENEGFIVNPLKEGRTYVTVNEKNKLKYKILVIVEYKGAGNWDIKKNKITIQSSATTKESIEKDVLSSSIFYDQDTKSFYNSFFYQNNYFSLEGNGKQRTIEYSILKDSEEYIFNIRNNNNKYHYTFKLESKSDLGVVPQHKVGVFSVDRTAEYQQKFPNDNVTKVMEEYEVECWYNL